MYAILLYILKTRINEEGESESNKRKKKAVASVVQNITIGTLVCYLPFIAFQRYNIFKVNNGTAHEVLNTPGGVIKNWYIIVAVLYAHPELT